MPESQEIDDTDVQLAKKKHGHYKTYSLEFKLSVVREVHQMGAQIGDVAEKFKVPRSTLFDWVRGKNLKDPRHNKGVHLRSGSGCCMSYPREVDEEIL